jgi:hypothetical protein
VIAARSNLHPVPIDLRSIPMLTRGCITPPNSAHEMGHLLAQDVVKNMHLSVAVAGLGGLYSAGRQLLSSSPANRKKKEGESGRLSLGLGLIGAGLVSRAAGMLQRLEPAAL